MYLSNYQEDIESKKDLGSTNPTPKRTMKDTVIAGRNYDSTSPNKIENSSSNIRRRYEIHGIYQTCISYFSYYLNSVSNIPVSINVTDTHTKRNLLQTYL